MGGSVRRLWSARERAEALAAEPVAVAEVAPAGVAVEAPPFAEEAQDGVAVAEPAGVAEEAQDAAGTPR